MSKKYTDEFKGEAVKLVKNQGYSVSKAAESLGISWPTLDKWIKAFDQETGSEFGGNPFEMQRELRRLREENRQLKMEREILKKATAFFAKDLK